MDDKLNPLSGGSVPDPRATARPTDDGFNRGAPLGYFTNPSAQSANPFAQGFPGNLPSQDDGNLWADRRQSAQPAESPDPGEAGVWNDEGFAPSGTGRS